MRIVWLQHVPYEGLGVIDEWAEARGHQMDVVELFEGGFIHPGDADLIISVGGAMGVGDVAEFPWIAEELSFLNEAVHSGKLVLGICLGAQMLASALGGEVMRNPDKEIGWYDVELTAEGKASKVLGVLPERFPAFHWHGDTFAIPPGAVRLASSEACANQAFEYDGGRVVGLQFHLEMTAENGGQITSWCVEDLVAGGPRVQTPDEFLEPEERFAEANSLMIDFMDAMAAAHAARSTDA